jgi:hypothetical protein
MAHNSPKGIASVIGGLLALVAPFGLIWLLRVPRGQRAVCWPISVLLYAFIIVWLDQELRR